MIDALIGCGLLTVGLFSVTVDADVFTAWVKQDLLPKLSPACVLMLDNATFHKRPDTQKAIANAGYTLEYLLLESFYMAPAINSIKIAYPSRPGVTKA